MNVIIQRDTRAWQMQVWIAFLIAAFLSGVGLAYLPGKPVEYGFMIMGYLFCLTMVFVLAKHVRNGEKQNAAPARNDTRMYGPVVWAGFFIAMGMTGWGLFHLDVNEAYKAFLAVSWLFLVNSAFTLAKMLRDRHDADLIEAAARDQATK
ncbi:YiaA/YiaB family inner membrane protein [Noviherbaspirillum galbum]|uniref:YiaAB two helix domain-containing protein n=1 Tax=Noviherbaspirillum galbum TaxID=2709383 RepID=A0A6B3SRX3_9BURK|nr:YiaA/YiaB family inner membrane protein [Noviherbaspirillum galbum]NEX61192.1 hypothetical protein [Noviherbaspirillum galbum]